MDTNSTYKLADLATILLPSRNEEENYLSSRRLQNWVAAGLLIPIGKTHGGRGVHRRYDRHELFKAAVLLEVFRYQLPITVMRAVAKIFDDARAERFSLHKGLGRTVSQRAQNVQQSLDKLLRDAFECKRAVFLKIYYDPNKPEVFQAELGLKAELNSGWSSGIVVNLLKVATRIK